MAAKEIYDYVSSASADYSSTSMSLTPQEAIPEYGEKNGIIHLGDDGSEERISLSNTSVFDIELKWKSISEEDAGTLIDFYHDSNKGNGTTRSFIWDHYDGHSYAVRFLSGVPRSLNGFSRQMVSVKLRVLGYIA